MFYVSRLTIEKDDLNVGYRMVFHVRARGEAECEIMKKTLITRLHG